MNTRKHLCLLVLVLVLLLSTCCLLFRPDTIYLTFLPEDWEWESGYLDLHDTGDSLPEWEERTGEEANEDSGSDPYFLAPVNDSDDNGTADLGFLKDLGESFRLYFTFYIYSATADLPEVSIPTAAGEHLLHIFCDGSTDPDKTMVNLELLDTSGSILESHTGSFLESYPHTRFQPGRWYSFFIDIREGNQVRIDIDERDGFYAEEGNDPEADDDVLLLEAAISLDDRMMYEHATFSSGYESETESFLIGMIYYRDCSDGYYPDPHGDDY